MLKRMVLLIAVIAMILSAAAVYAAETVDIEILVPGGYYHDFLENQVIPVFEANHPEAKIHILDNLDDAQLSARIAAGNPPAIRVGGFGYDVAKYAKMGVLVNLETMPGVDEVLAAVDPQFSREIYGGVYAIPWTVITQMMIYNKELFKEAGLDPEQPPVTFEEYLECARKIQELPRRANGDKVYGNVFWNEALSWGGWYWGMLKQVYLNFNGGQFDLFNRFGTDIVFDHPDAKMAEFFAFCREAQKYAPPNMEQSFFNRNIGMWLQYGVGWQGNLREARERPMAIGEDVGVAPLPVPERGITSWSTLSGRSLSIFKTDREVIDLAWEFIKLLLTPENSLAIAQYTGDLSPLLELQDHPYFQQPHVEPFMEQLKHTVIDEPWAGVEIASNNLLKVYLETVINETMEPEDAVRLAAQWTREQLTQQ